MSKKIISVMLALVLVLSTLATVAFAAGVTFEELDAEGLSTNTQTWSLGEPKDNGDGTYSVDVTLTTNYPTGAIQFLVEETDPDNAITLTGVTVGSAITYDAEASKNSSGLVVIVPQTTVDTSLITAPVIDGVVATLTYTYAGSGSAQIAIKNDPLKEDNAAGTLIAARMGNGNIVGTDFIAGQTVLSTGEARTIGAAADPELIAKAGTTGYVDAARSYVYGVPASSNPLNYFEATNGGYIEMSEGTASATNGTGATLTLYKDSTKATVIATYTLVIFGDVNGDGYVLSDDSTSVLNHAANAITLTGAPLFAADVSADGYVLSDDSTAILNHAANAAPISANVWAA